MNILILTRGKLPVPSVKGGAVEHLIQLLIDENEKTWHFKITLCTKRESGLEELEKDYRYCRFINIETDSFGARIMTGIRYVINKKITYIGNYFFHMSIKNLPNKIDEYDMILVENAPDYLPLIRKIYNGRIVFHGHNDWISQKNVDVLKCCDEYWTISEYLRNRARELGAKCKMEVLYNGIDISIYRSINNISKQEMRKQFGLDEGNFVFVFSGRIVQVKGVLESIRAFNLASLPDNAKLLIVGGDFYSSNNETEYVKECKSVASKNKNIIFTGFISSQDMPIIYAISDIGLFPSLWQEPFGLSILEMLASGLPVITTTNGAIPEIADESCAYLISSEDKEIFEKKMAEIMTDMYEDSGNSIKTMSSNARTRAGMFTKDKYLNSFEQLVLRKE